MALDRANTSAIHIKVSLLKSSRYTGLDSQQCMVAGFPTSFSLFTSFNYWTVPNPISLPLPFYM